jgi:hypothetical protein
MGSPKEAAPDPHTAKRVHNKKPMGHISLQMSAKMYAPHVQTSHKAPPLNNKFHSCPPMIWMSYMTECLIWSKRDVPNSTPDKAIQPASLILEGPFAFSPRNPG